MNDRRFDVVVVGSGPAGSTAALVLARAGARVALVDKAPFPREKACGDLIGTEHRGVPWSATVHRPRPRRPLEEHPDDLRGHQRRIAEGHDDLRHAAGGGQRRHAAAQRPRLAGLPLVTHHRLGPPKLDPGSNRRR